MTQTDDALEPLPPLRQNCLLHETVMAAMRRGYARSWQEAYGVGMYLANPKTREAAMAWMDHYGLTRSQFSALVMLRQAREEADDTGDVGV